MASRSQGRDPFDQWRSWLDRTERQVNKALNEAMASEQFGKVQGKFMEAMLGIQKSTNEATRRYFETLNMPTRADVLHLGEKLDLIEQKLAGVERAVAKLSGEAPAAAKRAKPKRTKKPPVRTAPSKTAKKSAAKGQAQATKKKVAKKTVAKKTVAKKKAAKKRPARKKKTA